MSRPSQLLVPVYVTALTRCFMLTVIVLVVQWVRQPLMKGLAFHAVVVSDTVVLTDGIFNWHPILMTFAFVGLLGEAVLAYKSPLSVRPLSRSSSKTLHWALHSVAAICIILGLIAVFKSHSLHKPVLADLYSPHSYLGMFTVCLAGLQYAAGLAAYLWPGMPRSQRASLSPIHTFIGLTVFVMGLATVAVGLQEKATFMQTKGGAGVQSLVMRLPAVVEIFLALVGITVLYHHAPRGYRQAVDEQKTLPMSASEALPGSQYEHLAEPEDQTLLRRADNTV